MSTTLTTNLAPVSHSDQQLVSDCERTLLNYIDAAKQFARDSSDWGSPDPLKFYTTDGTAGWEESCDNANGGLDLRWAFGKSDATIELEAPARLLAEARFVAGIMLENAE